MVYGKNLLEKYTFQGLTVIFKAALLSTVATNLGVQQQLTKHTNAELYFATQEHTVMNAVVPPNTALMI
eukprot:5078674-Ditylum_brightwellii.AAC.1